MSLPTAERIRRAEHRIDTVGEDVEDVRADVAGVRVELAETRGDIRELAAKVDALPDRIAARRKEEAAGVVKERLVFAGKVVALLTALAGIAGGAWKTGIAEAAAQALVGDAPSALESPPTGAER